MRHILIAVIKGYRLIFSPFFGQHCRFTPTCSCYGIEALHTHGALRGSWLTLRRLLRCHPWGDAGYDPVPELENKHRHG